MLTTTLILGFLTLPPMSAELVEFHRAQGYELICETSLLGAGRCTKGYSLETFHPIVQVRECQRSFREMNMRGTTGFIGFAQHKVSGEIVPICTSTAKPTPSYARYLCGVARLELKGERKPFTCVKKRRA